VSGRGLVISNGETNKTGSCEVVKRRLGRRRERSKLGDGFAVDGDHDSLSSSGAAHVDGEVGP
jgi:hypothetical protein